MGRIKRNVIIILCFLIASIDILVMAAGWEIKKNGMEYDYAAMRLDSNAIFMDLKESSGRITQKLQEECRKKKISVLVKGLDNKKRDSFGTDKMDLSLNELWGMDKGKKGDILYLSAPLIENDMQTGMVLVFSNAKRYYRLKPDVVLFLRILFGVTLVLNILLVIIFFGFRKYIQVPLRTLHDEIDKLLSGDTDHPLVYDYDDEIGEICHDVELMRGELQFEKKQSMKMRENEKNLLACMSHDMKTPLFAISSHVEANRDGIGSTEEEINQYIEVILNRVKIMDKLIEDILEHAEVEMQELSINPKNYFTTEFFPDIFEKIRQDFASHGNQVHLSEIPKYSLQIDPFRIQQVIFNIASNALKYSDNKTDLYITCNTLSLDKGTYFVVTMRDEGRGISASDLPFVFERFYRGEKARSSKIPGSGLGLHISKYIIEKHGGWIECDSVIGEGTTVSFSLPI